MRITDSMMVNQFLSDANNSLTRVSKYQEQVDSTKRVSHISDDPQATITALKARNKLSSLDMYQSNIKTANSYFSEAESATDELNEVLQTIYEQVVTASNGGKSDYDMSVIADEISSLQDEIVSIGNTTVGTTYLFGGFNFTGTTDASGTTTAPFSVDGATGHLIYNGIDLTQISSADDYSSYSSLMSDCSGAVQDDAAELASTFSDEYARDTVCANAVENVKDLISNAKAALFAAGEFGIDMSSSTGYKELSDFVGALSDLSDELGTECSKDLSGNYILKSDSGIKLGEDGDIDYDYYKEKGIAVLTEDEYANCFNKSDAQNILDSINELIGNTDTSSGAGLDYSMTDATSALQSEIDSELDASGAEDALAAEENNRAVIQVGVNNAVEYTFTGLDMFGTGKSNIHYILDKCISMLNSGDSDGLSGMITEIQDAQGSILTLDTKIGTTENRLELISNRYQDSDANYTEMKSNAIDVDMAEAITNRMTAQTVYNAALAAGAEIMQTSLLDFLS